MESACRQTTTSRKFVSGLSKCVSELLHATERDQWTHRKDVGERLWNPQKGGSYKVFDDRPLPKELVDYCVGDVRCLPALYTKFRRGATRWRELIAEASQARVAASQEAGYLRFGPNRAVSPWSAEQNKMLDSWSEVNPPSVDYFSLNDFDDWEDENGYYDSDDGNDYEDWTRADWEGPPS